MRLKFLLHLAGSIALTKYLPFASADSMGLYAVNLGTFQAIDINNSGATIGTYLSHNLLLTTNGYINLGKFEPLAINNNNEILGTSNGRNAIWKDGAIIELPAFTTNGLQYSLNDINDSGTAVGIAGNYSGSGHSRTLAIKYENGVFTTLGTGGAASINNSGNAVGANNVFDDGSVAMYWANGTETVIDRPVPDQGPAQWGAWKISNSGIVLGVDGLGAYAWRDGEYLSSPANTYYQSISDYGAVGSTYLSRSSQFGSLVKDGVLYDINSLILNGYAAHIDLVLNVTDNGNMLSRDSNGNTVLLSIADTAYLLPVPEPATSAMFVMGLALVGIVVRRKCAI